MLPDGVSGPSPVKALLAPVHLATSGRFPKGGVNLLFQVQPKAVPKGMTPFVATLTPQGTWQPVASTYDSTTGIVRAHVTHFSIWGVFSFIGDAIKTVAKGAFHAVFGSIKVTDPAPTCSNSNGLTVSIRPSNGIIEACAQNTTSNSVTLKLRSFLAFPIDVIPPSGTQISATPPGSIFAQIGGWLNKVSTGQSTRTLAAAGSEADLSFPLAAGSSATVGTELDNIAYLAGIIEAGVNVLTIMASKLGGTAKFTLQAIPEGQCASEISQATSSTSLVSIKTLSNLTQAGIDCAEELADFGVSGIAAAIFGGVVSLIESALQTGFLAAMTIAGGLNGTSDIVTVSRAQGPEVGAFAGSWSHHGAALTINSDGSFHVSARSYVTCPGLPQYDPSIPSPPGVPCENPFDSDAAQSGGAITAVNGSTVSGDYTTTNDQPDWPLGSTTFALYSQYDEILETWPSGSSLAWCGPNAPTTPPSDELACGA